MEYKKYKLGDICKIFGRIGFRGYTTEDLVSSPSNGAISLSPSNIVDGVMDLSKCTYISWEKYEESPEIKIAPNDIVIVKTGNSYGRTAIIRNVEHPMTLNPQFVVLKDIQINPVYLAYFLKTDEFQKQIYGIVGGSAIPTLSQEDLASLIVRVPNENIQNTIADILDSLDGKIELNKQINDNLEAMAKQLYDYWFVQFDFPNEEGKPYKSSGGAMVYNEKLKREIPKGWTAAKIKDVAQTYSGGTPTSTNSEYYDGGNIPWINSGELNNPIITSTTNYITEEGLNNSSAKLYPQDTVLVALYGATAGKVSLLSFEACSNQAVCGVIPHNKIMTTYIRYYLSSLYEHFITLSSGSARDNISQDTIKNTILPIPQEKILKEYSDAVTPIMSKIIANQKEMENLTKQRDELLPLLMNGQASINYHLSVY